MKTEAQKDIARWLWLGVTALGIAGLFALVLVIGRTPQLKSLGVMQQLFSVALVVHVDLSVLVWFLCAGGIGWSVLIRQFDFAPRYWATAGFWTMAAGTGLIAISPLSPHWEVLKSNYIPVLNNLPFLAGLGVLSAGLVVTLLPLLRGLTAQHWQQMENSARCFFVAGMITLLALVAFALSGEHVPAGLPTEEFFNTLFWAGGHILQFAFTLLMMAGWVALYEAMRAEKLPKLLITLVCIVMLLASLISLAGFAQNSFSSAAFGDYQTRIMIEWGGIAPILLTVVMLKRSIGSGWVVRSNRAYLSSLIASMIVFAAGGMLGMMIAGQNVVIPAHYHGEIVGVTLALMGFAYAMLPRLGYQSVAHTGLAFWQPIIYGVGQLMHVGGLAYSGGYGVLRKTAGGFEHMAPDVKIALGVMGAGGSFAILGGLLFVVVVVRAKPSATV